VPLEDKKIYEFKALSHGKSARFDMGAGFAAFSAKLATLFLLPVGPQTSR
jgi:hypothetical protein